MTKRDAYARVDKGDLTWGHLKHWIVMVENAGYTDGPSIVNPSMLKSQALEIFTAALAPNEDDELVVSPRYTAARNTRGTLQAVNVLRETHFRMSEGMFANG